VLRQHVTHQTGPGWRGAQGPGRVESPCTHRRGVRRCTRVRHPSCVASWLSRSARFSGDHRARARSNSRGSLLLACELAAMVCVILQRNSRSCSGQATVALPFGTGNQVRQVCIAAAVLTGEQRLRQWGSSRRAADRADCAKCESGITAGVRASPPR
jgi:hypothetical protein